jgi:hypothetical protein
MVLDVSTTGIKLGKLPMYVIATENYKRQKLYKIFLPWEFTRRNQVVDQHGE